MAKHLSIYTVVHQPRRLKLPAQPIPKEANPLDIARSLFDDELNRHYFHKVATYCYYPATELFLDLTRKGFRMAIGFSESFLLQTQAWDKNLLALFLKLVSQPSVELINVEPYHSFLPLIDLNLFQSRMVSAQNNVEHIFGKRPEVTDTTEMLMSDSIYYALSGVGFKGAFLDGREWVLGWRDPTHLYHQGKDLMLMARHYQLSDDIGYRFSNRNWWGYPLMTDVYAHWLKETRGDFVFLAWDYETFGEHHSRETGIFDFLRFLPEELAKRDLTLLTPSEVIEMYREESFYLPISVHPCTWAGSGGMEFFLGNEVQQSLFHLMLSAYNKALLTKNPELIELALWLMQSDNLHLVQWFGRCGSEAEVSAYFTPNEWWKLGSNGIISEMHQVYKNFIRALDHYL